MKTLARLFAAFALTLAPAAASAQTQDADPALWVVKDADTTIYLFGTVHVLKPGLGWFDEAVKTAFDKSDELKLEIVEPDPATMQALILKTGLDPNGAPLSQQLPEDKRALYNKILTELNLPGPAFEHFKPWLVGITLTTAPLAKLGYDPNSGAEKVLTAAAVAAHKPVSGLETVEQQMGFFDTLPKQDQLAYLVSTLDDYPKLGSELDKMVALWSRGDADQVGKLLAEDMKKTPTLAKILISDRDQRWADWIQARLAWPGTVFVAVGAAHLAGPDSVQAYLAKKHITVERIAY